MFEQVTTIDLPNSVPIYHFGIESLITFSTRTRMDLLKNCASISHALATGHTFDLLEGDTLPHVQ